MLIDESTGQTLQETNAIKHIGIDPEKMWLFNYRRWSYWWRAREKLRRELAKSLKSIWVLLGKITN